MTSIWCGQLKNMVEVGYPRVTCRTAWVLDWNGTDPDGIYLKMRIFRLPTNRRNHLKLWILTCIFDIENVLNNWIGQKVMIGQKCQQYFLKRDDIKTQWGLVDPKWQNRVQYEPWGLYFIFFFARENVVSDVIVLISGKGRTSSRFSRGPPTPAPQRAPIQDSHTPSDRPIPYNYCSPPPPPP